jgi:hypothetical protein
VADRPLDRGEALARLKVLSDAEHTAALAWEQALDDLRVAALANSHHVLPSDHPDYLTFDEMAEVMVPPRDLSRPYWWCKQLLDNRGGVRDRLRARLGRDPVPDYGYGLRVRRRRRDPVRTGG